MSSKLFRKSLAARPPEIKVAVQKYLDFILRLEAVRTTKGVTQQQLADVLQIPIQDWLSGDCVLNLNHIFKLEAFLKTELVTIPSTSVLTENQTNVLKIVHRSRPYNAPPAEAEWSVAVTTASANFAIAL